MASSVKYHKTYLKLHSEYESYAYPLIKKALDEQIKAVTNFTDETNFDDLQVYIQFLVNQKPLYDALEKIYGKVGVSAATFSYDWIRNSVPKSRKDFIIDFFNPQWYIEMVEYFRLIGGNKVTGIDETTITKIKNVLADILGRNLSRREQAKLFEETLNDPAFNRARSLVIARTESTTAANHGINVGAESSDYEVNKFWINTKDKRTRRTHLAMTNERIPINQPFIVGGIKMIYPGDPSAPAAEVVNCRCVMATEALVDSDGLPILKPRTPPYLRGVNTVTLPKLPKPIIQIEKPIISQSINAKTLKEAKEISAKIINDNTTLNVGKTVFNEKITLDQLNNYNKQINKLTKEYNISPHLNKDYPIELSFNSTGQLYGFVEHNPSRIFTINFGHNFAETGRTSGAVLRTNFGQIQFAPKSQVDEINKSLATVTHEFAHVITIEENLLFSKYPELKSFWTNIKSIKTKYNKEIKEAYLKKDYDKLNNIFLGDYANKNKNEFMAEAFTEYMLKSNPSKYALEVGKLIDQYFKKK